MIRDLSLLAARAYVVGILLSACASTMPPAPVLKNGAILFGGGLASFSEVDNWFSEEGEDPYLVLRGTLVRVDAIELRRADGETRATLVSPGTLNGQFVSMRVRCAPDVSVCEFLSKRKRSEFPLLAVVTFRLPGPNLSDLGEVWISTANLKDCDIPLVALEAEGRWLVWNPQDGSASGMRNEGSGEFLWGVEESNAGEPSPCQKKVDR